MIIQQGGATANRLVLSQQPVCKIWTEQKEMGLTLIEYGVTTEHQQILLAPTSLPSLVISPSQTTKPCSGLIRTAEQIIVVSHPSLQTLTPHTLHTFTFLLSEISTRGIQAFTARLHNSFFPQAYTLFAHMHFT